MAEVPLFLETSDVAREVGLAESTVRLAVANGSLRPSGRTRRGVSLVRPGDIEEFVRSRASTRRRTLRRRRP